MEMKKMSHLGHRRFEIGSRILVDISKNESRQ